LNLLVGTLIRFCAPWTQDPTELTALDHAKPNNDRAGSVALIEAKFALDKAVDADGSLGALCLP
jgi:hypothetical protein